MAFEISNYVNVAARLDKLDFAPKDAIDLENNVLLLPMNFTFDDDMDINFVYYPRLSAEIMEGLTKEGVPVSFLGAGSQPSELLAKAWAPDFILPTLFFGFSLYMQNPHLINVATNVMSHYAVKALASFGDANKPNQIFLDIVVETSEEKTTKKLSYRGPVSGLSELADIVRAAVEQERS